MNPCLWFLQGPPVPRGHSPLPRPLINGEGSGERTVPLPIFFYFPAEIVRFSAFWVLFLQFGCLYYTQNKLMVHRFAEPTPMGEANAWSAYSWIRACGV